MELNKAILKKDSFLIFFIPKVKFAFASAIATATDYFLYLTLVNYFFTPVISNIISAFVGMVINFILQKRFVFNLNRKMEVAFTMSLLFSFGGMGLSTLFIYLLNQYDFFQNHQYITKLIAIGLVFFYNFYTKKFSFEKKIHQL